MSVYYCAVVTRCSSSDVMHADDVLQVISHQPKQVQSPNVVEVIQ